MDRTSEKKRILSGKRIKAAKTLLGFTNVSFAHEFGYESSGHYVCRIFNGEKGMTEDNLKRLSDLIGWRYEYLAGLDDWQTEKDRLRDPAVIADAQKVILYQMGIEPASMSDKDRAFLFQTIQKIGSVFAGELPAKK